MPHAGISSKRENQTYLLRTKNKEGLPSRWRSIAFARPRLLHAKDYLIFVEKMSKPAGYPRTDGAEQDAVTTLLSCLNAERVKSDIKTRDKYPNVDGTLEIVDDEFRPEGKFDVQVRKVAAGTRSYSCPIELYAYSKVSSLPVLLITVDTEEKRAMWRHIFGGMPEFKENQKSFTIKFTADDEISSSEEYLERWRTIARDYSERIARYPELSAKVSCDIELDGVQDRDVEFFQRYSNELNSLLERDFQAIRARVLPPAACFGIGIASTTEDRVEYQHHRVEFGSRQPMVFRAEPKAMDSIFDDLTVLNFTRVERTFLKEPREQALEFLKKPIVNALRNYQLVVQGVDVACNVVSQFIEQFPSVFGIKPAEQYSLEVLQNAYYQTLPKACVRYLPSPQDAKHQHIGQINLWQMEAAMQHLPQTGAMRSSPLSNYRIDSGDIPIQAFEDSLKVLLSSGVETVSNPWHDLGDRNGSFIWSFTDKAKVGANLRRLFQRLIGNYSHFVRGNELVLTRSPYLDPNIAIIFNIRDRGGAGIESCPIIEEFHVPNPSLELPKVTTCVGGDQGRLQYDRSNSRKLILDGKMHSLAFIAGSLADWPFQRCPYLRGVYRLLTNDLNAQYGYNFHQI